MHVHIRTRAYMHVHVHVHVHIRARTYAQYVHVYVPNLQLLRHQRTRGLRLLHQPLHPPPLPLKRIHLVCCVGGDGEGVEVVMNSPSFPCAPSRANAPVMRE